MSSAGLDSLQTSSSSVRPPKRSHQHPNKYRCPIREALSEYNHLTRFHLTKLLLPAIPKVKRILHVKISNHVHHRFLFTPTGASRANRHRALSISSNIAVPYVQITLLAHLPNLILETTPKQGPGQTKAMDNTGAFGVL